MTTRALLRILLACGLLLGLALQTGCAARAAPRSQEQEQDTGDRDLGPGADNERLGQPPRP